MKIIGFQTRGFTVHQVHSEICLLKWYLCVVLLIWVCISATVFFPTRTESSCSLTQPFPAELWNTGQPQALVAGGHTSGHPTLKTIALNAACFVSLSWPTRPPVVGTGSHGYIVTDPSKARNKFFWQKSSDWTISPGLYWSGSEVQHNGQHHCGGRQPEMQTSSFLSSLCCLSQSTQCFVFMESEYLRTFPLHKQRETTLNTHPCIQWWSVLHSPVRLFLLLPKSKLVSSTA